MRDMTGQFIEDQLIRMEEEKKTTHDLLPRVANTLLQQGAFVQHVIRSDMKGFEQFLLPFVLRRLEFMDGHEGRLRRYVWALQHSASPAEMQRYADIANKNLAVNVTQRLLHDGVLMPGLQGSA
jgi:hypothetical protein